jgi:hypothetical protein
MPFAAEQTPSNIQRSTGFARHVMCLPRKPASNLVEWVSAQRRLGRVLRCPWPAELNGRRRARVRGGTQAEKVRTSSSMRPVRKGVVVQHSAAVHSAARQEQHGPSSGHACRLRVVVVMRLCFSDHGRRLIEVS